MLNIIYAHMHYICTHALYMHTCIIYAHMHYICTHALYMHTCIYNICYIYILYMHNWTILIFPTVYNKK